MILCATQMIGDSKFIGKLRFILHGTSGGSNKHLTEKSQLLVDVHNL